MDALSELTTLRGEILKDIGDAARAGNAAAILSATQKLQRVESLLQRWRQLSVEAEMLTGTIPEGDYGCPVEVHAQVRPRERAMLQKQPGESTMNREVCSEIRIGFIRRLREQGIELRPYANKTIFISRTSKRIGIAVATERQPDRWFLGLASSAFDVAVLLCQRSAGTLLEVCLPEEFFSSFGQALSISGGQLKFNVTRRGSDDYLLQIPGTTGVDLSPYLSNYLPLK